MAALLPETRVDEFGTISLTHKGEQLAQQGLYQNMDGHRFEDGRYAAFIQDISEFVPEARQFTDPVR